MVAKISLGFFLGILFSIPVISHAQINVAQPEDNRCNKLCLGYQNDNIKGNECNVKVYKCQSQIAQGRCQIIGCKGETYTGQDGATQGVGSSGAFNEILKGAMGLLQGLLQGKQQQQQTPPPPPPTGSAGCTSYYQVTAPSTDPCAYYVPPVSDSLSGGNTNASGDLLEALGGGSAVSDQLNSALNIPSESETSTTTQGSGLSGVVSLQGGTQGDIQFGASRTTVVATSRDPNANTEIAGFYGSNTIGGEQPQSLAARMCKSRPWAVTTITYIIPPTFFDSLCASRGYQVGSPVPTPKPTPPAVKPPPPPAATTTPPAPPPTPTIPPEIDIWAVPAKVSLGSRTTIFWNTKGVDSCTVLSPDGSFNEKTLSGGAATVPLSGATTFTISCLTPSGTPVTDYVTVNMAI